MRILVTGASGLVGAAAVDAFAVRGHRVRAFVRGALAVAGADEVVRGDVCDAALWPSALVGVDVLVHAAGAMTQDPAVLAHTNVRGVEVAAAAAHAAGCRRVVLVSSAAVYAPGPMRDAGEDTPVGPPDAYGQSKLAGEVTARRLLAGALTILRPVSVFASSRSSPFLDVLRAVVAAGRIPLVGDGATPLDLVHADDLATAIAAAAEGRGAGGVFNVCGKEPAPFLALARVAAVALGVPLVTVSSPAELPTFPAWLCEVAAVPRTLSDRRARVELGYAPMRAWREEVTAALRVSGATGPA